MVPECLQFNCFNNIETVQSFFFMCSNLRLLHFFILLKFYIQTEIWKKHFMHFLVSLAQLPTKFLISTAVTFSTLYSVLWTLILIQTICWDWKKHWLVCQTFLHKWCNFWVFPQWPFFFDREKPIFMYYTKLTSRFFFFYLMIVPWFITTILGIATYCITNGKFTPPPM